ncbi:hypothetical protein AAHK20_22745 [Trinickia sp. YCB016]
MAWLLACSACAQVQAQNAAQTAAESDPVKALAAPPATPLPLKPNPEFAKFPSYAGTLGSRRIVLRLGAKTDDPSGVHGEYQFADTGEVILIAGDRDGDTLEVEESNDGTRITGNWVGKFAPDGSVQGDRMNVDDSDPQPFDLHPAGAAQAPAAGAKPAIGGATAPAAAVAAPAPSTAQPSVNPAPGAANPHAVGGVGNLSTGD